MPILRAFAQKESRSVGTHFVWRLMCRTGRQAQNGASKPPPRPSLRRRACLKDTTAACLHLRGRQSRAIDTRTPTPPLPGGPNTLLLA